jgi:hypothetical protein
MVLANNTTQYNDYSLYEANATGEAKKAYRDAHFSNDCQNARQLGEQLASGKGNRSLPPMLLKKSEKSAGQMNSNFVCYLRYGATDKKRPCANRSKLPAEPQERGCNWPGL